MTTHARPRTRHLPNAAQVGNVPHHLLEFLKWEFHLGYERGHHLRPAVAFKILESSRTEKLGVPGLAAVAQEIGVQPKSILIRAQTVAYRTTDRTNKG